MVAYEGWSQREVRLYQDSILNKIISCGYNDAWFVTLRSKVTTALEETNEETISNHNMGANQT